MKHRILPLFYLSGFTLTLTLNCCTPELDIPEPDAGNADLSRVIAIGGDYMAGYQDGALYLDGQERCLPALLARQFAYAGGGAFRQVTMPDNSGLGWNVKP